MKLSKVAAQRFKDERTATQPGLLNEQMLE